MSANVNGTKVMDIRRRLGEAMAGEPVLETAIAVQDVLAGIIVMMTNSPEDAAQMAKGVGGDIERSVAVNFQTFKAQIASAR